MPIYAIGEWQERTGVGFDAMLLQISPDVLISVHWDTLAECPERAYWMTDVVDEPISAPGHRQVGHQIHFSAQSNWSIRIPEQGHHTIMFYKLWNNFSMGSFHVAQFLQHKLQAFIPKATCYTA